MLVYYLFVNFKIKINISLPFWKRPLDPTLLPLFFHIENNMTAFNLWRMWKNSCKFFFCILLDSLWQWHMTERYVDIHTFLLSTSFYILKRGPKYNSLLNGSSIKNWLVPSRKTFPSHIRYALSTIVSVSLTLWSVIRIASPFALSRFIISWTS